DGRQDLAVAIFDGIVVAQNMDGRFEIRTVLPASESTTSLTAADYDCDGRLDLYLCAYSPDRTLEGEPQAIGPLGDRFVFHDAENGTPNTLYHNEIAAGSEWRFADVTRATGLGEHNTRWSFAATWDDFDNDGDQDLYVANDYGRNCLYQNESTAEGGVRFRNLAASAGAEDSASGMSAAWGDYDRDGWMDLYVANMFSAAGSRVTRQARFKPGIAAGLRRKFQHFARGNTLLRNLGRSAEPGFQDTSEPSGVTIGR
ncbi:MAG: VCBS repeat-containing protein, partial [Akkermansiaceae bacterium]|nr:VCBS repeat-containing protein [Akkermansiaceae bacterium]